MSDRGPRSALSNERVPPSADVIVVLGCAVRGGRASPALERRVALAVHAHRQGVARAIIVSGGRRWDGHAEAVVMRDLIVRALPAVEVLLELRSLTTAENALFSAKMMRDIGARTALVASCGWHLPRALADFRRAGIDALAPPAAWIDSPPPSWRTRTRELACDWLDAALLAMPRDLR